MPDDENKQARVRIIVSGLVQGVCFRYGLRREAENLQLTGWVRNCRDGTVEAVAEGEKENLRKLITWCHQGPPGAAVRDVTLEWQEYRDEFSSFSIKA